MTDLTFVSCAEYELRFWMQIFGDHARFIRDSFAPGEREEIERASYFVGTFDKLLGQSRQELSPATAKAQAKNALVQASKLRDFKLHLLRRHLLRELRSSLPPTFYNHMVNELEEGTRVLTSLADGDIPSPGHALHQHLLWLPDASGHAASLRSSVDLAERKFQAQFDAYTQDFDIFYLKAVELAGYLRAHVDDFPALRQFNRDVSLEVCLFHAFLKEIEEMELENRLLGSIAALMPDHMAREECYYLRKLSEAAVKEKAGASGATASDAATLGAAGFEEVAVPDCDPTHPRVKDPRVKHPGE